MLNYETYREIVCIIHDNSLQVFWIFDVNRIPNSHGLSVKEDVQSRLPVVSLPRHTGGSGLKQSMQDQFGVKVSPQSTRLKATGPRAA